MKRPIYRKTAAYGHFGRALPGLSWEHTTRLDDFKSAVGAVRSASTAAIARVARVLPDLTGLDKEFDYLIPEDMAPARAGGVAAASPAARATRGRLGH